MGWEGLDYESALYMCVVSHCMVKPLGMKNHLR